MNIFIESPTKGLICMKISTLCTWTHIQKALKNALPLVMAAPFQFISSSLFLIEPVMKHKILSLIFVPIFRFLLRTYKTNGTTNSNLLQRWSSICLRHSIKIRNNFHGQLALLCMKNSDFRLQVRINTYSNTHKYM